jgi:hypothetical protein
MYKKLIQMKPIIYIQNINPYKMSTKVEEAINKIQQLAIKQAQKKGAEMKEPAMSPLLRQIYPDLSIDHNSSIFIVAILSKLKSTDYLVGALAEHGDKEGKKMVESGGKHLYIPGDFNAKSLYIAGVSQYIISEILELAGRNTKDRRNTKIIPDDIYVAIAGDSEIFESLRKVCDLPREIVSYVEQKEIKKQKELNEKAKTEEQELLKKQAIIGEKAKIDQLMADHRRINPIPNHIIITIDENDEDGHAALCPVCGCGGKDILGTNDWTKLEWNGDHYTISPHVFCNRCDGLFVLCPDHVWTHNDTLTFTERAEVITPANVELSEIEKQFMLKENKKTYKIPLAKIVGICNMELMKYLPRKEKTNEELCNFIADLFEPEPHDSFNVVSDAGDLKKVMKKHGMYLRGGSEKRIEDWCHDHIEYKDSDIGDNDIDNLCDTYFMTLTTDSYNIYEPITPYPEKFDTCLDGVIYVKCISSTGRKFKTMHWGD